MPSEAEQFLGLMDKPPTHVSEPNDISFGKWFLLIINNCIQEIIDYLKKHSYHKFGIVSISISILVLIIIMLHIHFAYKLLATSTSTPNWLEIARFSGTLGLLTLVSCFVAFVGAILGLIALIKSVYHHAPIILTLFWFMAFLGNLGLILLGFVSFFIGFRP